MQEQGTLQRVDKILIAAAPLAWIGVGFLNLIAFMLDGHQSDSLRRYTVWGVLCTLLLCLIVRIIPILFTAIVREKDKSVWGFLILPIVYVGVHIIGILLYGNRHGLLKVALQNLFLFGLLFCSAFLVMRRRTWRCFIGSFKWYSLAVIPLNLYYILRLLFWTDSQNYEPHINLGIMSYMDIAYLMLMLSIMMTIDLLLYSCKKKKERVLILFLITVNMLTLAYSSTRGALLCAITYALLLFCYSFLNRTIFKTCICLSIITFLCVVFSFVALPAQVESRNQSAIEELISVEGDANDFASLVEQFHAENRAIQKFTNDPEATLFQIPSYGTSDDYKAAEAVGMISEVESQLLQNAYTRLNHTSGGARLTHWLLAIEDFLSSPGFGNGPFYYFSHGYGYPHNALLELASDFGCIGLLAFMLFSITSCYVIFTSWKHSLEMFCFGLFPIVFFPQILLSGSLYGSQTVFIYGVTVIGSFAYLLHKRRI